MINIILADHQRIFRIGMASVLAAEDDFRIVGQPYSVDQLLHGLEKFRPHVLLLSSAYLGTLDEIKRIADRQHTAILLLAEAGDPVSMTFSTDLQGVIQRSTPESTVVHCVRHLARGGRVLRITHHQSADDRQDSVGIRVRQRLSPLELRIVVFVVQGYRNREIALRMGTTEQAVKNSLRRIFDKTGVYDRVQLALFVLHHRILAGDPVSAIPPLALHSVAAIPSLRGLSRRATVN